ncbi:MAG: response regulator [Candidatus Thiodiazotropha sp.]|jgi:signal transduction histidine kinase/FixJ family two-component response regulator
MNRLKRYLTPLFGTLRGQLILGVALLIAVTMALFVGYLTDRQQDMLLERQTEHATALANSIATSSSGWLAARDYSGLQEIIDAQGRYPDLLFAMILAPQGQVLAHSDPSLVGKYLQDFPETGLHETATRIVSHTAELVDVITPVVLAGFDIGWVRVGLGQETTARRLRDITRSGILHAIVAIVIGSLAVAVMGWRVTRRLYAIQTVADAIQGGEREMRVRLEGEDEAAKLGNAFDSMLNTLAQREKELQRHRDHLSELVEERTADLIKARDAAEAANKAKSVFLANMSHELRTPLNAVLGFSQLMKNAPDTNIEQRRNLDIITHSGEHLLNLINNVLDISKIESGRVELEESHLDLHQLLLELKSLMYVRASEKGLEFNLDQSPDLPRNIAVDGGKLRQVLINLIGNAIKYTNQGSVILKALLVNQESTERALVRFEVVDSGPGIRTDDRERIFSPFVQLGDRPPTEAGTGLGLAICKQYIDLMSGQISIDSEQGKGSVFHFEIPVTLLASDATPAAPGRGRVLGPAEGQPVYRILIVEDQPENRLLLRQLLDPLGFDLREAVNGQEGLELFQEWHPHLIFMDIRMPVMDGLQATQRIKASHNGSQTHIIALTAHALEEERKEILAAGCDDFIRKPYTYNEILDALTHHLGVSFVYEDDKTPTTDLPLDAKALAALPGEVLNALEQALARIDLDAVNHSIEEIRSLNSTLADALAPVARNLQFGKILQLIRSTKAGTQAQSKLGVMDES